MRYRPNGSISLQNNSFIVKNRDNIEVMAPAGNFECLMAAIQGGGLVYFGIDKLNMRSHSANNFALEDLEKVCNICQDMLNLFDPQYRAL